QLVQVTHWAGSGFGGTRGVPWGCPRSKPGAFTDAYLTSLLPYLIVSEGRGVTAGALELDRERRSRCARSRFGSRRNGRPSRSWISGPHQAASCRSEAIACTHRVGATVAEARRIAMDSPPSIGPRTVRLAGCYGRCHGTTSVEGKRGHSQRQRGQLHQQQQVVITGYPVESKATAVRTAMDEDPPALPANGDGDRLHPAGTVGTPITG